MLWNAKNGQVPVGGSQMRYVRFGRGPENFVILPGLSDGLATVQGKALLLAKPYARFFDRYTVYMFSRRDDLPEGCSIRDMAADQAEAMRALGIEQAAVMGVSQGGMIAQILAAEHPALVDKLVLAVTAPNANDTVRACVERWIEYAEQGDHRALMADTAEKSYSEAYLRRCRRLVPLVSAFTKPASYARFLANARAILGFDARDAMPRIQCPTLILGGAEDKTVGADAASALHEGIAGSALYVYPGLGHGLYEEAKDFYPRVYRFLTENHKKEKNS